MVYRKGGIELCWTWFGKIPPFWRKRPDLWFQQVEAQFNIAGITQDQTKYSYVIGNLDCDVMEQVSDFIANPPSQNKFPSLKERLIAIFADSEEHKLRKLLNEVELGDQKPSQLLRQMKDLARNKITDEVLKSLWFQHLPLPVQTVLAVSSEQLDKLAAMADKITEVTTLQNSNSVNAVDTNTSPNANTLSRISDTLEVINSRLEKLEFSRQRGQSTGCSRQDHQRERSASRNRQEHKRNSSKSPTKIDTNYCWYHLKFGNKAKRCRSPCTFLPKN